MKKLTNSYSHKDRIKEDFYNSLPRDYSFKKPIKTELFISFLKVPVERSNNHLGMYSGRPMFFNKELGLVIRGDGKFLDSIEYGEKLSNSYNNFVSPFYLFDILSEEGQSFFIDYYKEDIEKIIKKQQNKVLKLENELKEEKLFLKAISEEIEALHNQTKKEKMK